VVLIRGPEPVEGRAITGKGQSLPNFSTRRGIYIPWYCVNQLKKQPTIQNLNLGKGLKAA